VKTKVRYSIVIEIAGSNYSAYCPDLPGCAAMGKTAKNAVSEMKKAIRLHLAGMKKEGLPIPPPNTQVEYIEIPLSI
jgi:predicted RNase H-like HicB family nuclease